MKIDNMINNAFLLLDLYRLHSKKLMKKIKNEEIKALLLISYKEDDILEMIENIMYEKELLKDYLEKNDLNNAYRIYKDIKYKYKMIEKILIDRIEDLIKIRALDIMKSNH
ncbi:MAG: hypothetical protein ACP5G1_00130 [Nanopusillaceae archaeon]